MPVVAAWTAVALLAAGAGAQPPGRFSAHVTNQWFPLTPGTTSVYRGVKDGLPARDVVSVTHLTTTIDGARCAVVHDRLYLRGKLRERTIDWYAQDRVGNVWYFGEDTAELGAAGHATSTEGTWRAGRNGARPGVYMPAHPRPGQSGRQEYYRGHAEDHFRVVRPHASVTVPYVTSHDALLTAEWTPLEPGVLDHKLYVRGIGTVLEQTVKAGTSVTRSWRSAGSSAGVRRERDVNTYPDTLAACPSRVIAIAIPTARRDSRAPNVVGRFATSA